VAKKSAAAAKDADKKPEPRVFASNRQAFHDYHVLESLEAGIALTGTEIKSVRAGKVNLRDSYARVQNGEVWLYNMHVSPYEQGNRWNHEPTRPRKLLLHTREIGKLARESQAQGLTLVPLRMYASKGVAKIELAVVRGKKQYDKRDALADRESRRDLDRAVKEAYARGR
jgi:SsrA-binding protein